MRLSFERAAAEVVESGPGGATIAMGGVVSIASRCNSRLKPADRPIHDACTRTFRTARARRQDRHTTSTVTWCHVRRLAKRATVAAGAKHRKRSTGDAGSARTALEAAPATSPFTQDRTRHADTSERTRTRRHIARDTPQGHTELAQTQPRGGDRRAERQAKAERPRPPRHRHRALTRS